MAGVDCGNEGPETRLQDVLCKGTRARYARTRVGLEVRFHLNIQLFTGKR